MNLPMYRSYCEGWNLSACHTSDCLHLTHWSAETQVHVYCEFSWQQKSVFAEIGSQFMTFVYLNFREARWHSIIPIPTILCLSTHITHVIMRLHTAGSKWWQLKNLAKTNTQHASCVLSHNRKILMTTVRSAWILQRVAIGLHHCGLQQWPISGPPGRKLLLCEIPNSQSTNTVFCST